MTRRTFGELRKDLLLDYPFFGFVACSMKPVEDPRVTRVAMKGNAVHYNPTWLTTARHDETLAHIVDVSLHRVLAHVVRRGQRDPETWFRACHMVNGAMMEAGGLKVPPELKCPPEFVGKSVDYIYNRLSRARQEGQGQGGNSSGTEASKSSGARSTPHPQDSNHDGEKSDRRDAAGSGDPQAEDQNGDGSEANHDHSHGEGPCDCVLADRGAEMSPAELISQGQIVLTQAAALAKGRGHLPAALQSAVLEITHPRRDWESELRRFFDEAIRDDYTWQRPNRRYLGSDFILPAIDGRRASLLVVIKDTSGSVSDEMVSRFWAIAKEIISEVKFDRLLAISCDAAVQHVTEFSAGELPPAGALRHGCGGTDFRPPFDLLKKTGEVPTCLLYLTDMNGSFPDVEPEYPVIWLSIREEDKDHATRRDPPFGELIPLDLPA